MTTMRPTWRIAQQLSPHLGQAEHTLLDLVSWLPLVPVPLLARIRGLGTDSSTYRALTRLQHAGLVATVAVPLQSGWATRLWYPTDLGLAVLALHLDREIYGLARERRLGARDLERRAAGLPQTLAYYALLAALVSSQPGSPYIEAWSPVWRPATQTPRRLGHVAVRAPALATIAWRKSDITMAGTYLLLADLATCPIGTYRSMVRRLMHSDTLPLLLLATTSAWRGAAWQRLLNELAAERRNGDWCARIATWEQVYAGLATGLLPVERRDEPGKQSGGRPQVAAIRLRLERSLPRVVGSGGDLPGTRLVGAERAVLSLIGHHPFLGASEVATLLDMQPPYVRACIRRLKSDALVRHLDRTELGVCHRRRRLVELTRAGLDLLAAQQGLALETAVRVSGLVGGGPPAPIGSRRALLRNLTHTRGVYALLVSLHRTARCFRAAGRDDAVVEWLNAVTCSRRHLRPDAYAIYRHDGRHAGFFLEYDRGTLRAHDYRAKFHAYHRYLESGQAEREYDGFPDILVVTTNHVVEARIAQAIRAIRLSHSRDLPVLLTTEWRILANPGNRDGLLGPIWRTVDEKSTLKRICWPPGTGYNTIRLAGY